jgi:SpoVK/Ycf46/Vps4 family AAA+-type ATPase
LTLSQAVLNKQGGAPFGPAGTGKTEIAKIMGQIFAKIGILKKGTFKKVTRSDLIAGYLGQTAIKTTDVIKECLGGVLFIDEAYSLGSPEKRDTFSKECIDTLCEALSDHKDNLMVIVAGYEHELNECFFNSNQGLNSRFTWRFKTDEYSAEDLYQIFLKKVKQAGWDLLENTDINTNINTSITVKWFEKHKSSFVFYGRDIETLFAKIKIAHSRRVFCLDEEFKKKITIKDMDKGLEIFLKNENNDNTM